MFLLLIISHVYVQLNLFFILSLLHLFAFVLNFDNILVINVTHHGSKFLKLLFIKLGWASRSPLAPLLSIIFLLLNWPLIKISLIITHTVHWKFRILVIYSILFLHFLFLTNTSVLNFSPLISDRMNGSLFFVLRLLLLNHFFYRKYFWGKAVTLYWSLRLRFNLF